MADSMIAGYIRVSTITQKDNWSVSVQRERAIAFAKAQNEQLELYDEIKSARNLERPELNRLINDIKAGKISKVWVVEFSRLSRDPEGAAYLSKLFRKHKVELFVLDQFIDLTKSDVRFTYNINAAVNAKSSDDTSERVIRTKQKQKSVGAFVHSTLYGYSRKFDEVGRTSWHINENEASVIRRIFAQYGKGVSLSKIAKELESEKVPQRRGKRWTAVTVTKLLQHPEYFGLTKNDDGQLIKSVIYEPILDSEDYARLTYQKDTRRKSRENFRVAKHILSGLLVCGSCGARFYPHRVRYKNKLYENLAHKNEGLQHSKCKSLPKYIDLEKTTEIVDRIYRLAFDRVDHLERFMENLKQEIYQTQYELAETRTKVELELKEIEEQRKRLVDAVANGVFLAGDIREKMNELKKQREEREKSVAEMKMKLEIYDANYIEALGRFRSDHLEQFDAASLEEKRKMYHYAIKSLKKWDNRIEVVFITGIRYTFRLDDWQIRMDRAQNLRNYLGID